MGLVLLLSIGYYIGVGSRFAVGGTTVINKESSPLRVGSSTRQNNSAFTTFETN